MKLAEHHLDKAEEKWRDKYPSSIKSWRENRTELGHILFIRKAIRKMIYTTNTIENFNRQLRKVTTTKASNPSDGALLTSLYLVILDVTKKWTGTPHNWMKHRKLANDLIRGDDCQ